MFRLQGLKWGVGHGNNKYNTVTIEITVITL